MSKNYFVSFSIKNKVTGDVDFNTVEISFPHCSDDGPSMSDLMSVQKQLKEKYLEEERNKNLLFPEDGIKITILFYKRIYC